jgi:hypothetical protein
MCFVFYQNCELKPISKSNKIILIDLLFNLIWFVCDLLFFPVRCASTLSTRSFSSSRSRSHSKESRYEVHVEGVRGGGDDDDTYDRSLFKSYDRDGIRIKLSYFFIYLIFTHLKKKHTHAFVV